ncbi:MAG TPA: M48 family metallopeptidase, partial [Gaiellaceae bacterium]|nr:M48 family metallopeptidase [Gaiellaceae bacterium]
MESSSTVFAPDEVERARRYHRPLYILLLVDTTLGLAALSLLVFTRVGSWLYAVVDDELAWWGRALLFPILVLGVLTLLRLPLSFWCGHVRERRWGFSTQTAVGWLLDRAKGFAVAAVLSAVAVLAFVALARTLPGAWPAAAAPGAALFVLALGFAGPIVLEPLFNRFRPLGDPALAGELRALAERAGVPVRDVLVADASRRTRRENAYVSGLGGTRRIVLFDNLLEASEPRQIRLVVAHELGHRRARHVERGTLLAMAGAAVVVLVLWGLLSWPALLEALGAFGPGDPRVAPFLFLVVGVFELVGLPLGAALSRRWEREADRSSLELTRDPEAFEAAHRRLARANLADLEPPRAL